MNIGNVELEINKRQCEHCGAVFEMLRNKRFCSAHCRTMAHYFSNRQLKVDAEGNKLHYKNYIADYIDDTPKEISSDEQNMIKQNNEIAIVNTLEVINNFYTIYGVEKPKSYEYGMD